MSRIERARELQDRTKKFALRIISAFSRLPKTEEARVLGRQFLRSGTSVAANYRAACRSRSAAAAGASTPHLEKLYAELKALDVAQRDKLAAATSNS